MTEINPKLKRLQQTFARSIVTRVDDPLLKRHNIRLWVKRDDLLHPIISGNKWRKLKYSVNHALLLNSKRLVSMGGAYSNHLHALAYIGKYLGLSTTGIIRGERPLMLNPTLVDLERWGMDMTFISRQAFKDLRSYQHFDDYPGQYYQGYWIAEGGAGALALKGVGELAAEIEPTYDIVCLPCGTGTTMAGLLPTLQGIKKVIGFAALKGATFIERDIKALLHESNSGVKVDWTINLDYHFGGFAGKNNALLAFIDAYTDNNKIALDPVYTGKMFYGIYDLIKQGKIAAGQRLLAVHTGGLQGARGL